MGNGYSSFRVSDRKALSPSWYNKSAEGLFDYFAMDVPNLPQDEEKQEVLVAAQASFNPELCIKPDQVKWEHASLQLLRSKPNDALSIAQQFFSSNVRGLNNASELFETAKDWTRTQELKFFFDFIGENPCVAKAQVIDLDVGFRLELSLPFEGGIEITIGGRRSQFCTQSKETLAKCALLFGFENAKSHDRGIFFPKGNELSPDWELLLVSLPPLTF